MTREALWHDVECASYSADLSLWRDMAAAARGPILDLGAGTGRVALDLAERGHEVTAVDSDPALVDALAGGGSGSGEANGRRPLYALPTYTALLELRDLLADRGVARRWSE